jgi:hypothetical protein
MPIKIFAGPGDHRDDFCHVESQANKWLSESAARVVGMESTVNSMPGTPDGGTFRMTLVIDPETGGK